MLWEEKMMSENCPLKVLLVSSEVAPFAKSGGLGDVAGSLPKALKKENIDIRVVLPKYKTIKTEKEYEIHHIFIYRYVDVQFLYGFS